jgi:hypothetical protein
LRNGSSSFATLAAIRRAPSLARFKSSDLADAAETRDAQGCLFRFAAALVDGRGDYRPRLRTFVRFPKRFVAAISRHDLPDLDSV